MLTEDWGKLVLTADEFSRNDIQAIEGSEAIILVTTTRLTRDMFLELGVALGAGAAQP